MINQGDTGAEHLRDEPRPGVEASEPDSTSDYALERAEQRELKRRAVLELREVLDDKPVRLIVEYLIGFTASAAIAA